MEPVAIDVKPDEIILSEIDIKKLRLCAAHPEMFRGNPGGSVMLSPDTLIKLVNTMEHLITQNTELKNNLDKSNKDIASLKIKASKKVDSDFRFILKELRLSRRWSRDDLSKRAGISETNLKYWELGYGLPSLEELQYLKEAFGIQGDALSRYVEMNNE